VSSFIYILIYRQVTGADPHTAQNAIRLQISFQFII